MFADTEPIRRGTSAELCVLMHGFDPRRNALDNVRRVVEDAWPNADILQPRYRASPFLNRDPTQLAAELEDIIERVVGARAAGAGEGYEKVVLIGHSIGAVLLRKAYAYAWERREDYPINTGSTTPRRWVHSVERLVLLAGMNRGWSLVPKPTMLPRHRQILWWIGLQLARLLGLGRLFRSMQRGAPFIANLRVQWVSLALADRDEADPVTLPTVIQLLGTVDDVVSQE